MKRALLVLLCFLPLTTYAGVPAGKPQNIRQPHKASGPVVVNAASYLEGISPGSIASIFGVDLTPVINGTVSAQSVPLPQLLGGVSIYVDGVAAPMYSVTDDKNGNDQINFQVPFGLNTGESTAIVEVVANGQTTARIPTSVFFVDPAIFQLDATHALAVISQDNTVVTASNPAFPKDYLVIYATGLGQVTNNPGDGEPGPDQPLAYAMNDVHVFINGEDSSIYFAGLAPGFIGVFQVNVQVPGDAPHGDLDMQLVVNGQNSAVVKLTVQ